MKIEIEGGDCMKYGVTEKRCSFCGKKESEVDILIRGKDTTKDIYICDKCAQNCNEIVQFNLNQLNNADNGKNSPHIMNNSMNTMKMKPTEIKKFLDDYIIGQDSAKKALSVAIYNHYKRINDTGEDDVELQKSNVLLVGPTGTGKTLLVQTIARILDVPLAIADATSLTEAGYVGEDVENVLTKLVQNAKYDIAKAEKGIVYIDEIDKIGRKSENVSITRDVSGEGVQQALLKIIEGSIVNIPPEGGRKHPEQKFLKIDTKNILFICGGAFEGIEKIINSRTTVKGSMGFTGSVETKEEISKTELLKKIMPNDLVKFGLIPELIGRLPVITVMSELTLADLIRILTEPKNSIIKQYVKLFKMDNVELKFEKEALEEMAKMAVERNVGARGLRSIVEEIMLDIMYEIPVKADIRKCIITKNTVIYKTFPMLLGKKQVS